jgi:hypothetical protein
LPEGVTDVGSGVTLHCPGCHYEIEVILGIGFMYYSLENVIGEMNRPGIAGDSIL